MRRMIFFILVTLLNIITGQAQRKIMLNDLSKFSQYHSKTDFERFGADYNFTLYTSNLIKHEAYDDLGFIKNVELKAFNSLKNGDSLCFNQRKKIYRDGKKTRQNSSFITFRRKKNSTIVAYSTTAFLCGNDYIERICAECEKSGFIFEKSDTLLTDQTATIQYKGIKNDCTIICTTECEIITGGEDFRWGAPTDYKILFTRKSKISKH